MKWNDINSENSKIRVKEAYEYWLNSKSKHIRQAANLYKTSPTRLKNYILQMGHRLESHNINIFNNIDTEEKAYWLGFLFADGSVSIKTNLVELSLQANDVKHLEKFKNFAECTNTINCYENRCRLVLGSSQLKKDLIKWGCTPQKSLTLIYPKNLPENLNSAFIRGVFDGDGSIVRNCKDCLYNSCSICSGSKAFLKEVAKKIEESCNFSCKLYRQSKGSNTWLIMLSGAMFKTFIKWLYYDSKIHLDRKYKRFQNSSAMLSLDKLNM